jgi:lysophospholipase L1-like esterase
MQKFIAALFCCGCAFSQSATDWPNLARYHDENARLAAPAPGESRVVFMGDSITDGWGRQYGQFFPGKPYVNRGISGQTTPQMLIRFRPANNIRVVLASVMPVCNYIKPQTERRPPEKIIALNAWIKDYAAKNSFVYLDYYSAMLDDKEMFRKELTYDGLHPNDAGYEVMGPLAEKAIAAALAK